MSKSKYEELFEKVVGKETGIGGSKVEDPTKNPAVQKQQQDIAAEEAELSARDKAHPAGMKFVDQVKEMTPKKGKAKKADPKKPAKKTAKKDDKKDAPKKAEKKKPTAKQKIKAKVEKTKAELRKKTGKGKKLTEGKEAIDKQLEEIHDLQQNLKDFDITIKDVIKDYNADDKIVMKVGVGDFKGALESPKLEKAAKAAGARAWKNMKRIQELFKAKDKTEAKLKELAGKSKKTLNESK